GIRDSHVTGSSDVCSSDLVEAESRGERPENVAPPAAPDQTVPPAAPRRPQPVLPPPAGKGSAIAALSPGPRPSRAINLPVPDQRPTPDPLPGPVAVTGSDLPMPVVRFPPHGDPPRARPASRPRPGYRPDNAVAARWYDQKDGVDGQGPSKRSPASSRPAGSIAQ